MRKPALIVSLLAVVVLIGLICFIYLGPTSREGLVPLDQLPDGYLSIARKELPQVNFDKVWRLRNGNYEIRGKDAKGKAREVELDANGRIVEVD
jgi:hypothetical protein